MGEMEQICFQIISCSGTAKSMYVEAIQKAKANDYVGAKQLMEEAEYIRGRTSCTCNFNSERGKW